MSNNNHKILIVDDDSVNITALVMILEDDYELFIVKDGQNAIDCANKVSPDIILLDVIMPDMDGFETLGKLKLSDKTKDIPVIFITGLKSSEDEEKGLALGAVDYIYKPFDPATVTQKVRYHLCRRE